MFGYILGYVSFEIELCGECVFIIGDMVYYFCQFEYVDWVVFFDVDLEFGIVMWNMIFECYVDMLMFFIGLYFYVLMVGYIVCDGDVYCFDV